LCSGEFEEGVDAGFEASVVFVNLGPSKTRFLRVVFVDSWVSAGVVWLFVGAKSGCCVLDGCGWVGLGFCFFLLDFLDDLEARDRGI
jgi:hypothetical protein